LRAEKDILLRIDLLEAQSSSIAKMLARAIMERNDVAFAEYAERLASNKGRLEELMWVLGEKSDQGILDLQVYDKYKNICMSVREIIEKLKTSELHMDDLSDDTQAMVRKGALEMKNALNN